MRGSGAAPNLDSPGARAVGDSSLSTLLIFTPGYPHPVPQCFASMLGCASPFTPSFLPPSLCCQLAKAGDLFGAPFVLLLSSQPVLIPPQLSGRGICSSTIPVLCPAPAPMDPARCESCTSDGLGQGLQGLLGMWGREGGEGGSVDGQVGC